MGEVAGNLEHSRNPGRAGPHDPTDVSAAVLLDRIRTELDWCHLMERVWEAANVFHPKGSKAAEAWMSAYNEHLMKDDPTTVIRGLKQSLTKGAERLTEAQRETLASVIGYVENNKDLMSYRSFMHEGHPIGTGTIEGGTRHQIGDRTTPTAMRWKEPGRMPNCACVRSTTTNG